MFVAAANTRILGEKYLGVSGVALAVWGLLWGSPGLQVCEIAPLDPAEKEKDQGRVVGGDTGPSVPHTSHIFDT